MKESGKAFAIKVKKANTVSGLVMDAFNKKLQQESTATSWFESLGSFLDNYYEDKPLSMDMLDHVLWKHGKGGLHLHLPPRFKDKAEVKDLVYAKLNKEFEEHKNESGYAFAQKQYAADLQARALMKRAQMEAGITHPIINRIEPISKGIVDYLLKRHHCKEMTIKLPEEVREFCTEEDLVYAKLKSVEVIFKDYKEEDDEKNARMYGIPYKDYKDMVNGSYVPRVERGIMSEQGIQQLKTFITS